ncbi:ATP-dependent RNA helicase DBP2-like isoform X2 [Gastrolobium bilobum]|uniref:ATP-dependent RNA helicase DBP2-like isoform X2 n=1 Tax=Gastrolobium bilobum TaxID=150636 RepID=UPI002AB19306|nr:ATP-dependent RNA helicase DBP2-like isoform X2 [Gastrolobium bilobum]
MSYVPPHLRNGSSTTVATLDNHNHHHHTKLAFPSSNSHSNDNNYNNNSLTSSLSNASRRSSVAPPPSRILAVPDPVIPHWQPSERVSRMNPDQIEEVRLRLNLDVTIASDSPAAPAPIESFTDMCLHPSIMKDIAYHEYTRPTSIQAQAMPVALSGRDLLGCAETGSGKTAAFTIPMIQHCLAQPPIRRNDGPMALILAPTRELAQQIEKEVKAFSRSLESLKTAIVVGGTNIEKQRSELRAGLEIVVATPGRFIDHLQQGNTSLSRISFVVLDEADRMLDMGFEPQIREVMRSLPEKHQTLLFSATMPEEIEALAKEYLASPVQVRVGKVSSPTTNVSQTLVKVSEDEKIDRLLDLLVEEASQAEKCGHPFPLTIVFVERKTRCDEIAEALVAQGLSAVSLHGGRSQSEREAALQDFRSGSTSILVATDVASRGLDVTGVSHVINLDLPKLMNCHSATAMLASH